MNQIINELRAALSLANTVSTSTNDAYMDGVACGIAFCLEQLDEGSTSGVSNHFTIDAPKPMSIGELRELLDLGGVPKGDKD